MGDDVEEETLLCHLRVLSVMLTFDENRNLNVNSINVRLPNVLQYLSEYQPDVLCLQELKCAEEKYPLDPIKLAGYQSIHACQKTYNGVSIISKGCLKKLKLTQLLLTLKK